MESEYKIFHKNCSFERTLSVQAADFEDTEFMDEDTPGVCLSVHTRDGEGHRGIDGLVSHNEDQLSIMLNEHQIEMLILMLPQCLKEAKAKMKYAKERK